MRILPGIFLVLLVTGNLYGQIIDSATIDDPEAYSIAPGGQTAFSSPTSALYLDGGVGLGYFAFTVNYEFRLYQNSKRNLQFRLRGGGYALAGLVGLAGIHAGGTCLIGNGSNHFEFTSAALIPLGEQQGIFPLVDLGYRYETPWPGFLFRAKIGTGGLGIGIGVVF